MPQTSDKGEVDSPGFRYAVSKNPFNARAVRRFHHSLIKVQVSLVLSNLSKIETLDVQDTEGKGFIHSRTRTSQQRARVLGYLYT